MCKEIFPIVIFIRRDWVKQTSAWKQHNDMTLMVREVFGENCAVDQIYPVSGKGDSENWKQHELLVLRITT